MSIFKDEVEVPNEIWLQLGCGEDGTHTWTAHKVDDPDFQEVGPYVRADRMPGRVTVKALEWIECADGTWHDKGCRYELEKTGRMWRVRRAVTGGGGYVCDCGSLEQAKAAAQADHQSRTFDDIEISEATGMNMLEAFEDTLELALGRDFDLHSVPLDTDAEHLQSMLDRIRMNPAEFSPAKLGSWLGYAQGVLVALNVVTLDEMKEINKRHAD